SHTRLNGSARDSPAFASNVGDVLLPDPPELPVGFGATAHARLPLVSYSHPRPGALRDRGRSATDAPLGRTCARATRPGSPDAQRAARRHAAGDRFAPRLHQ